MVSVCLFTLCVRCGNALFMFVCIICLFVPVVYNEWCLFVYCICLLKKYCAYVCLYMCLFLLFIMNGVS